MRQPNAPKTGETHPHEPFDGAAGPIVSSPSSVTGNLIPAATRAATIKYWWTRLRDERSLRVIVGGTLVIPALVFNYLHLKGPALVLLVPGVFLVLSVRVKRL
jgi:hypothetical protein